MDKYYYFHKRYKIWMHRTPLKLFINPILRFIQFWTTKPFVIASDTDFDMNDIVLYYSLSINNTNHLLELDNNLIETTILELYNGDYEEVSEIDTTVEASGEGGHYYQISFYYNNSFVKTIDLYVYQSFIIVR